MREHPIPQDITGYRFHIVGNMTIKQFAEIGFGCLIAFFIYQSNLVAVLKWPLMGLVFALGAGAAFVPIEERPLDHWIITFFQVLYKPTKFFWRREPKIPEAFLYTSSSSQTTEVSIDLTPARRQRIKEYLNSVEYTGQQTTDVMYDQDRMASIMTMFDSVKISANLHAKKSSHKPNLKIRTHSLTHDSDASGTDEMVAEEVFQETYSLATPQTSYETSHAMLDPTTAAQDIAIPEQQAVEIALEPVGQTLLNTTDPSDAQQFTYAQTQQQDAVTASQVVMTNTNLPFPSKPSEPNKVVGMVLTPQDELINDAVIEITKQSGETVRAVKTNALGQFYIMTPLESGEYVIQVEKEGLSFQPLQLTLTGRVVDPIEIRSYN